MDLVDLHCHLDLYPDFPAIIDECEANRVYTLAVTTTPLAWPRNHELTKEKKFVRAALGMHPQLVADRGAEIAQWERYAPEARYIGEVGLDASRAHKNSIKQQKDVFGRVLDVCDELGGKMLTVHSVRSGGAVLDMLESRLCNATNRVVLHWFTGTASEARRALDLGYYFSVNYEMTRTASGKRIVQALPVDRLLTETDGPFTSIHERPTRPIDVVFVLQQLAHVHDVKVEEMASQVKANLTAVLKA